MVTPQGLSSARSGSGSGAQGKELRVRGSGWASRNTPWLKEPPGTPSCAQALAGRRVGRPGSRHPFRPQRPLCLPTCPLLTGLSQPPEGLSLLPPAPRRCGLLELIPPQPKCAESGFKVFLQGRVSRFIFHYREYASPPLLQPPNSQLFPPAWPRLHPQEQVTRTWEVTVPWAGAVLQGGREGGGCARPAESAGQTPDRADSYLRRE